MSLRRAVWDVTVWGAGWLYVALVLCLNIDSPALGACVLALVLYELMAPHRASGAGNPLCSRIASRLDPLKARRQSEGLPHL